MYNAILKVKQAVNGWRLLATVCTFYMHFLCAFFFPCTFFCVLFYFFLFHFFCAFFLWNFLCTFSVHFFCSLASMRHFLAFFCIYLCTSSLRNFSCPLFLCTFSVHWLFFIVQCIFYFFITFPIYIYQQSHRFYYFSLHENLYLNR